MDIRYPIGKFQIVDSTTPAQRAEWIEEIAGLPNKMQDAVQELTAEQLNLPYREGGWMLRQVVHHVADSHINAYTRFKLALTEETPTIKPYFEDRWAQLEDSIQTEIRTSIALLDALHQRWGILLKSMKETDYERSFYHPEMEHSMSLGMCLGLYAWHGNHHVAHIMSLRKRLNI